MNINPKIAVLAVCSTLTVGLLGYVGYNHFLGTPAGMSASELATSNARIKSQLEGNLPEGIARSPQVSAPVPIVKPRIAGDVFTSDSEQVNQAVTVSGSIPRATALSPVIAPARPNVTALEVIPAITATSAPIGVAQEKISVLLVDVINKMQQATDRIVSIGRSFDRMHSDTIRL